MARWRELDHVERETELREIRARWDAAVEDHPTPDAEESFADNGLSDMGTLFDEIDRLSRAAAVPAPDAGDDTLREQLARITCEALDWRWLPERTETGHTLVPSPTEAIMPAIDAVLASGRVVSTERGTTHFEWGVRDHEGHVGLHANEHSARETCEAQRDWMFPPQGLIVRTVTTLRTEWKAVEDEPR